MSVIVSSRRCARCLLVALPLFVALCVISPAGAWAQTSSRALGELDCNGDSPVQQSVKLTMACTDIRGSNSVKSPNIEDGRFYDNGVYIGHDEPDVTFLSNLPNSGASVSWAERLPVDPSAAPTVNSPGSDITHEFELSLAPWFSMDICDSNSYPLNPCTPKSDANAPRCNPLGPHGCPAGAYTGAGSAFMEMQFYPPGFAPFADSISCDDSHWCAALTIDSLECTLGFQSCNGGCEEPVNFAFIQRDGIPSGPPSPQESDLASLTPNANTLLMNPGDGIRVSMHDAAVPGQKGQHALLVKVADATTGQSGYMQASAVNGFQNTSIADCSGTPFNFEPEYNTARRANIAPWTALQTNISTQFETGHFEPCSKLTGMFTLGLAAGVSDTSWKYCHGAYENAGGSESGTEPTDALCYPAGDTHGSLNTAPDEVTGCIDNWTQNGDLNFDGTPYWADWPTSTSPSSAPSSFIQDLPVTGNSQYSQFFIQTDLALSESTCDENTGHGCGVPPPTAPGHFYPYWTRVENGTRCTFEFGNVSGGANANDYGKDAQYGTDRSSAIGYPEFEGPVHNNTCAPS